ncbi:myelin-associated glycoprotein-like [Mantella aurantiaca]
MNGFNIFMIALLQATCTVQQKEFNFPSEIQALIGSCVEIPCMVNTSATEPKNAKVVWHVRRTFHSPRIIYSSNLLEISSIYKNRAALIGNPEDSCSLRIHEVAKNDEKGYYPGDRTLPSNRMLSKYVQLRVTDVPPQPVLSIPEKIIVGTPILFTCSVEHTCGTSPPSLNWNFPGWPVTEIKKDFGKGKWLTISELTYRPSGEHNGSSILCIATFPNGQTSQTAVKLNILEMFLISSSLFQSLAVYMHSRQCQMSKFCA